MLALSIATISCLAFLSQVRCQNFEPVNISLTPPPSMTGVLASNDILEKAIERRGIEGPESFAGFQGKVYASGKNGIYRLDDEGAVFITSLFKGDCNNSKYYNESVCGRPLGIAFNSMGLLYVADAYNGIFTINLTTLEVRNLVSKETLDEKHAKFINSIQVTDKFVYFTSSSKKWDRAQFLAAILEGRSNGRLFRYNMQKKVLKCLLRKLTFPNGLLLSPEQDTLLIAQTPLANILKYNIKSKNKTVIFAENLPLLPDNLKYNALGNVLVASGVTRFAENPSILDKSAYLPILRTKVYKAFKENKAPLPKAGLVLELNPITGVIERSMHDVNGTKVSALSEAFEFNGQLYLGSYVNPSYFILNRTQF